ncbi:MAG: hypothetical protein JWR73_3149 [Tardiphaga sp.]|nr:hypothetical protein [Tardiphaga sp.]
MKNISVLAAFAAFAVGAMISTVSASMEPTASLSVASTVVMPSAQELPFDRYWSKD